MKVIHEFKSFALKGNVIDMAVGIIIGLAFGKIVTSIVNDIIMPPISMLVGAGKFSNLAFVLKDAVGESPAIAIKYGNFLQVSFDFLLISIAIFIVVKVKNAAKRKEEAAPVVPLPPTNEEILLTEIRDLLKK
jgi:large conductance mechanosensitive channel